jgi:hypothetical protein
MQRINKKIIFCLTGIAIVGLVIVYGRFDPGDSYLFPKCPFKVSTGYSCPGCGSQRAIHEILNLRIGNAIKANALLVVSIPYLLILSAAQLFRYKNRHIMYLYYAVYSAKAIWGVCILVVLWWVIRNF